MLCRAVLVRAFAGLPCHIGLHNRAVIPKRLQQEQFIRERVDPFLRLALTRVLRGWLRLQFRVRARDANCPLRAYDATFLAELLGEVDADAIVPNLQLTVLAERRGTVPVEVPVRHRVRRGGDPGGTMFTRGSTWQSTRRLAAFSLDAFREMRSLS